MKFLLWHLLPAARAEPVHLLTANMAIQLIRAAKAISHDSLKL
jgi:hypothetical protein